MAPRGLRAFTVATAIVALAAACGGATPSASPASAATPIVSADPSADLASGAPTAPGISIGRIASAGSIAIRGRDGSLRIVDAGGDSFLLADTVDGTFGFPTWSPDGTQIAALRADQSNSSIVLFNAADLSAGTSAEPDILFESATVGPFYLFWTPDGHDVSFLANEADSLSLRLVPADGSAPVDGSAPGAVVRTGNPFYYDWIGQDRLIAHIGVGADAFLGEIGLDGAAAAPALETPGDFRSAVVSQDRTRIAFVRGTADGPGEIVVAARDGSGEHSMPVFGTSAVVFAPAGNTLASIGPVETGQEQAGIPVGPLRLIDIASGDVRTLIDGLVVSFWWSPDGQTIAALRVQPVIGSGASPSPGAPVNEVRLLFVDVATGAVRSQPTVLLGQTFVEALFPYFDQYALSHRFWAPDSSSMLLPEVGPDGRTRVAVRFPDGDEPIVLDGEIGFWSP